MDTFARIRPIWFVLGAIMIVIIVVSLIFNSQNSNKSSSSSNNQKQTQQSPKILTDYAIPGTSVSFTQDGLINANLPHRSINITVSSDRSVLTIYEGYDGKVLNSYTFANNQDSYKQFLSALNNVGYTTQSKNTSTSGPDGQCPLGYRYMLENTNMPGIPESLWTTSCSKVKSTFGGSLSRTQTLFTRQIPDYSKLTSSVNL